MRILGKVVLTVLLMAVTLAHADTSQEEARKKLEKKSLPFKISLFFEQVEAGNTATVRLYLQAGMSPDAERSMGISALMLACEKGDADTANALIAAKANLDAKDHLWGKTALMRASQMGHVDIVKALIKAGADMNSKSDPINNFGVQYPGGETATTLAEKNRHPEIVEIIEKAIREKIPDPVASAGSQSQNASTDKQD